MPTTPNYALPYPGLNDQPNGPLQIEDLAEAVDTQLKNVENAAVQKTTFTAKGGEWLLGTQNITAGGGDKKITATPSVVGDAPVGCTYSGGTLTLTTGGLWTVGFSLEVTAPNTEHWCWLGDDASSAVRYTGSASLGSFYGGEITKKFAAAATLAVWAWSASASDLVTSRNSCRVWAHYHPRSV